MLKVHESEIQSVIRDKYHHLLYIGQEPQFFHKALLSSYFQTVPNKNDDTHTFFNAQFLACRLGSR